MDRFTKKRKSRVSPIRENHEIFLLSRRVIHNILRQNRQIVEKTVDNENKFSTK